MCSDAHSITLTIFIYFFKWWISHTCYHFSFIETAPKPEYEEEDGFLYEVVDDDVVELGWDYVYIVYITYWISLETNLIKQEEV